ncbi:MAG: hypothetical protein KUG74_17230 [Rhodobacteraceae bacterium]|nr:hypothetical protein [Paracoccaceae bacterium]
MKSKLHAAAGAVAMLTIATFWVSTLVSETFGTDEQVAQVKFTILYGMVLLIPAMAAVGGSGFAMGKGWRGKQILAKHLRMKIIGGNGILILIPSAFFLASRAQVPNFDGWFYAVQTLEIIAGATNFILLGLNMRYGIALARRRKKATAP